MTEGKKSRAEMAWAQMGRFMGHFCETERLGMHDRRWFALDGADYDDCRALSESTTAENLVPFLDRTLGLMDRTLGLSFAR